MGPRRAMITPWSTNAVEITQNMRIEGITRIEEFHAITNAQQVDPMLYERFDGLDQALFTVAVSTEAVLPITDIAAYNDSEGLALSPEEIQYLEDLSKKMQRPLTDSEVFGFSQVNSEHCRHKIFNGTFIVDGLKKNNRFFNS